mgnify:CR=1 FL=1
MPDVYKQSFKQNYTNNIELSIFNCGLERCAPGQTWGPGIRDHYLIHLVVSGRGTFEVGGRTFAVAPGDLFFARRASSSATPPTSSSRGSTAGWALMAHVRTNWPRSSPLPTNSPSTTPATPTGCAQP